MTTDVDIVNAALIRLGERTIASLAEPVKPAQLAGALFADLRDTLLREHPWNFALTRASLVLPAPAAGRFSGAWLLPDGAGALPRCLRLLAVEDSGGRYLDHKVDGRFVRLSGFGAAVNLLSAASDLTDGAWSVSGGAVSGAQAAAPFGFGLADALTDSAAGTSAFLEQTVAGIANGALFAASVLVRPGMPAAAFATLELRFTGGAGTITGCYVEIDLATGDLAWRDPAGTVQGFEREALGNGWYRLSFAAANNHAGNDTLALRLYADGLTNGDPASQLSLLAAAPRLMPAQPLSVVYVAQITDPDRMDPSFRETLAARLALELAEPLGKSTALQQTMAEFYADKLRAARSADGQEGSHDGFDADSWLAARI